MISAEGVLIALFSLFSLCFLPHDGTVAASYHQRQCPRLWRLFPLKRIRRQWPVVGEIRKKYGVESISVGILHEGKMLFTGSTGYRDVGEQEKADTRTLYTLCSISKSFVAAAVGILVDRGKCKWEDPVGLYLPEFTPNGDTRVATEATFNDFLRHSGGLANPIVNIIGPEGKVLVPQGEFVSVLNDTPTGSESFGPYFNAVWEYSNVAYGLVGLVIERLSGKRYADFVSEEILKLLGMYDTAVHKSRLAANRNVARSCVRLSDGSWFKQPEYEWTDELSTPLLAMIGIRSSVKDLLVWCAAMMDAYWGDTSNPQTVLSGRVNPLREVGSILDDYYCSLSSDDDLQGPCDYHLSWTKCSWVSWIKSLEDSGGTPQEQINSHILGRDSPGQTMYQITGVGFCGVGSVDFFPGTRNAIVVLSSGVNAGNPSEFTAALLMQEVFDLESRIEILPLVDREIEDRLAGWEDMMADWREHRDVSLPERALKEYIGRYRDLSIELEIRPPGIGGLEVVFNGKEKIAQVLEHYNEDMYSYLPTDRDDWLRGAWLDWDHYMTGVLHFHRDKPNSRVTGVAWTWDAGRYTTVFKKEA